MFNILNHKGNANQISLRFHLTPVRMAFIKKITTANTGEDPGEKEPLYTIGENVN
jgi:hypothetical protein